MALFHNFIHSIIICGLCKVCVGSNLIFHSLMLSTLSPQQQQQQLVLSNWGKKSQYWLLQDAANCFRLFKKGVWCGAQSLLLNKMEPRDNLCLKSMFINLCCQSSPISWCGRVSCNSEHCCQDGTKKVMNLTGCYESGGCLVADVWWWMLMLTLIWADQNTPICVILEDMDQGFILLFGLEVLLIWHKVASVFSDLLYWSYGVGEVTVLLVRCNSMRPDWTGIFQV